jgi:hypothetical protein
MPDLRNASRFPAYGTTTITIAVDEHVGPSASWSVPASTICSYTLADDGARPSAPLCEGAVRVGNSILAAFVPENAILRDTTEDF